jgi:eight-cysteine-cluster-containing protein
MKRGKRGQLQISFGMIFSIILIIAFVAVAIYAIIMFLNLKKCSDLGSFKDDLQGEIDRAYSSDESNFVFNSSLSSGIRVCFIDLSEESKGDSKEIYTGFKKYGYVKVNTFYWPLQLKCPTTFNLNHLNITEITKNNNPYCISNLKGKISLKIEKNFYDSLVYISRSSSSGGNSENENCVDKCGDNICQEVVCLAISCPCAESSNTCSQDCNAAVEDEESSDNESNGSYTSDEKNLGYVTGPAPFCGFSVLSSCNSDSDCVLSGCSRQVCSGKGDERATTCEWKPCYREEQYNLECGCVSGKCRWN